jgi:hypothetical protein
MMQTHRLEHVQRMMEVLWQDLDPSEELRSTDGSEDEGMRHAFSQMIHHHSQASLLVCNIQWLQCCK